MENAELGRKNKMVATEWRMKNAKGRMEIDQLRREGVQ